MDMKHDLKKITFVIPFQIDSPERDENLRCILKYLCKNFDTNILLIEQSITPYYRGRCKMTIDSKVNVIKHHHMLPDPIRINTFHRTKVINEGIKLATTPYISIYDADVILKIPNYVKAYELLKQGASLVYPYDGKFVDINRQYIKDGIIKEYDSHVVGSYGGACFLNKKNYIACGLENENIISWGPEDMERHERVLNLGYQVVRVQGNCYHIKHPTGVNSSTKNPYWKANEAEYYKVKDMSREELAGYVKTWGQKN